jgi:NAD(P)-dependent dehydrogenase (short-subunit alcohol dehydrogenase family)
MTEIERGGPPHRLDGKAAIVTGGSRGIGRAIAATFLRAGAEVMIAARKQDQLEAAANALGPGTTVFAANAGRQEDLEGLAAAAMKRWGRIDILVNNAATNPYVGRIVDVPPALWDKTQDVNLRGPLLLTQLVWHASMARSGGVVVNIASIGGLRSAGGGLGVYDATKAAIIDLTKRLATELAPSTRVNAVAPGLVVTDMSRALLDSKGDAIRALTPLRRLGEVDDVARAALFLASDASSWITGDVLVADGGRHVAGASGDTLDSADS